MKCRGIFLLVLCAIFISSSVFASVSYINNTVANSYSAGDSIRGKINASFTNEPANSNFRSNFNGTITLRDLFEANNFIINLDYNCSSRDCLPIFTKNNQITSFNLNSEGFVGVSFEGQNIQSIDSFKIRVQSSAAPSCTPQLFVDVGDANYTITNQRYTTQECFSTNYGCFETNRPSYQYATIPSNSEYCEKIRLPAGPAFKIGANITNTTTSVAQLNMKLLSTDGEFLGNCALPGLTKQSDNLECIVPFSSSVERDYLVCVSAQADSSYKIRTETNSPCGTNNLGQTYPIDYELYAKNLQFGSVDFTVNEDSFHNSTGQSLRDVVQEYLSDKYDSSCSPYCIFPLRLYGQPQQVGFSDVNAVYDIDGAQGVESSTLFEVKKDSSKITSGFLNIELQPAKFTIPLGSNASIFTLYLNSTKLFDKTISVSPSFYFDLYPKFVSFGQEVTFVAKTTENISSSTWSFGDGQSQTSSGGSVKYRYLKEGNFTIDVQLIRNDGTTARRTFNIIVGDPKDSAEATINDYTKRISSLSQQINSFEPWIQTEIKKKIDLVELNASLSNFKNQYDQATTSEDYQAVMLNLIALNVPTSIQVAKKGTLPLSLGLDSLDVKYIQQISGKDVSDQDSLKNSIINWMSSNFASEAYFESITAFYSDSSEVILTRLRIQTKPKQEVSNAYLIIPMPLEAFHFKEGYGERSTPGATYITLTGEDKTVEFALDGDVSVGELGAYISPEVDSLGSFEPVIPCNFNKICEANLGENRNTCSNDCRPWGWFSIWIVVIIVGGFIAYIILQEWYKKNYQKSLFKKEEFLYNLINFIYNARRQNLSTDVIRGKLKEAGWTGEQITFAQRKLDGKRTGMYEIPIFKSLENKKVVQELQKRQASPVDARFIKRRDVRY